MSLTRSPYKPADEQKLMTEIWDPQIADHPYNFVKFVYPWGKENTPLAKFTEPRTWQRDEMEAIADHIASNRVRMELGVDPLVYQSATASGRGTGKSALTAWLNHWMMSTRLGSTSVNSANTETQLKTRTWAELGKWHTMAINSHWFEKSALSLKPTLWFEENLKSQLKIDTGYYYAQAQLWSEENPDAFAGVHNFAGMLLIFDEASGIPQPIWTVAEGFFTEPILDRYWFVFSNPRRNTGSFFECFHTFREYWTRRNLDARSVEGTDKTVLNQIVSKYGDDSDEARIEVKGQFPRQGDRQFISSEIVDNAAERDIIKDPYAPLIMAVDPARYGDDKTVVRFRQGRDARSIPPVKMKGKDNMQVANECAYLIDKMDPDAIVIDSGNGSGIIDRLRELGYVVHECMFGGKPDSGEWFNRRTELWALCRDWLGGGCIENDPDLKTDLKAPEYKFMGAGDKLMLETKEELKKRGFHSPDDGDALCMTFAVKPARRDSRSARRNPGRQRTARDVDYKIFG